MLRYPEKCNLNFKHINDNDNNNDDKTAILWFRFYHIQVRMTGLWTISDFHFSDNSNCINFGLVLRLTNFYLEFGHYSKETSDGIWGNYWHTFFLTPPGRKSKSKKLGLFIIISTQGSGSKRFVVWVWLKVWGKEWPCSTSSTYKVFTVLLLGKIKKKKNGSNGDEKWVHDPFLHSTF